VISCALNALPCAWGQESDQVKAERLFRAGVTLAEKTHYLEALDLLDESRMFIETSGDPKSPQYSDILFALAQTKIKGRIHQDFPAFYVKTALKEIQSSNKLRDKLPEVLPQKLAEGLFLEGTIQKRFFMRKREALSCFSRCVEVDPGHAACKRELSSVIPGADSKQDSAGPKSDSQDD
jgi:hypothetical protein